MSAGQEHRLIIAGFGGQGILTTGKLLCTAALNEGREVTFMPAYGTEVRGGTANCHVVISDSRVFSPLVEKADSLLIMNQLSMERFGERLKDDGLLLTNSSLVESIPDNPTATARHIAIPATERAAELGNVVVANVLMLGAFVRLTGICSDESVLNSLRDALSEKKPDLLDLNLEAYETGGTLSGVNAS